MNQGNRFRILTAGVVLVIVLVLSGVSCGQKSDLGIEGGNPSIEQPRGNEVSTQGTMNENATFESSVDSVVSTELETANQDQTDVSSGDSDDKALVTSDSEAFSGVGALGSEYNYE